MEEKKMGRQLFFAAAIILYGIFLGMPVWAPEPPAEGDCQGGSPLSCAGRQRQHRGSDSENAGEGRAGREVKRAAAGL